jgi:Transposase DDE domain group 1
MGDCATTRMCFQTPAPLVLEAAFDGGRLTSDGGLCWLAKADEQLGLCEAIARQVPEWRGPSVRHSLLTLVRQRVYQIACGYEDQDDADALRKDPLLKSGALARDRSRPRQPTDDLAPGERPRRQGLSANRSCPL